MAFVHHTASGNGYSAAEAPAVVRGIYAYHTKSLHWSDVGYNFLIDRYGTIYEGRYGGVARGVIGAQVLGFNTGSTGISVIGTFSDATPPSRAVTSLERLLEWKLDVHHVDPLGTGTLVCGYGQKFATGQRVTFPAIAGHRDANYTDCPGGRLYAQLPNVRKVVARTGQPKIYGFIVGDPSISPNGDGVRDRTTIGFTVSQTATWTVEIRDDAGRLVRHIGRRGDRSWRRRGPATTTTARRCRTASTRCGPTRPAPTARRAPRRRPAPGHGAAAHRERRGRPRPVQPQRGRAGRRRHAGLRPGRVRDGARLGRRRRRRRPAARDGVEGRDRVGPEASGGTGGSRRPRGSSRRRRARRSCCSSSATAPATRRASGAR